MKLDHRSVPKSVYFVRNVDLSLAELQSDRHIIIYEEEIKKNPVFTFLASFGQNVLGLLSFLIL